MVLTNTRNNSRNYLENRHSSTNRRVYIEEDGCNRRLLELSKIQKYLELNNYELVNDPEQADLILLSTCSFKKKEEDHSIRRLRKLRQYNAELIVYGCLPDISPAKFQEFQGIKKIAPKDLDSIDDFFNNIRIKYAETEASNVIDEHYKLNLFKKFKIKFDGKNLFSTEFYIQGAKYALRKINRWGFNLNKNYFLYICRGCLGKCSYCAIKRSIGDVKSRPLNEILNNFRKGINDGYKDFVILGDDPGCYGLDNGSNFPGLLAALLEDYKNLQSRAESNGKRVQEINLHINEIHPKHLLLYKNELPPLLRSKEIKSILCPIQSGNNRILKLMQREHKIEDIKEIFGKIREVNQNIGLHTQIIIGFPTETDEDFSDTLDILKAIKFNSVVIFPYHDKENSRASNLTEKIPEDLIQRRVEEAHKCLKKAGIKTFTKCPT